MTTFSHHRLAGLFAALALAALAGGSLAQTSTGAVSTKDIVLDRVSAPAANPHPGTPPVRSDAMAVSVLLESPDGYLTPRSTQAPFATGDRFRVKLLASRSARVSLYNTNPSGRFNPQPIWQGQVMVGQETVTPRLRLDGQSGMDLLHVVLEPEQPPQGVIAWIGNWLRKDGSEAPKDIRLDSQDTPSTSYLLNHSGQGLVTTIRIVHR